ncbi:hypothetical protein HYV84_06480 [Candidatus Woesearchaeota archaeon]|nr:hypothetical protein [Candidatus Woesearchaeota archaeon]
MELEIIGHAKNQYCLRKYGSLTYWVDHLGVVKEIERRVRCARPSSFNPRDFFKPGVHIHPNIRMDVSGVSLLQDDEFIYAVRDNKVFTVINIPGTDAVSDFFFKRE